MLLCLLFAKVSVQIITLFGWYTLGERSSSNSTHVRVKYKIVLNEHVCSYSKKLNTMPNSTIVGYARVSSVDQNLDRQLVQLKAENVEKLFIDKVSGKNLDRPGFSAMMEYVREGDVLVICSMDRLARSLMDLLDVTRKLQEKGVTVKFLKEKIELSASGETSAISKLLLAMMGAVAEFERSLIRERQQQGIALAKARGVYRGRKPIDDERIEEAKRRISSGIPKTKVAKDLKIGRTTLYKYLKQ